MSTPPITTNKYKNNEILVYAYLRKVCKFNIAASCAVLANIAHEALPAFYHQSYNPDDNGGPSYGLCQWHDSAPNSGRFTQLKNYCRSKKLDYTTVEGQLAYLTYELQTSYYSTWSTLVGAEESGQGAYDAAKYWCINFEVPSDKFNKAEERGKEARDTYYPAYEVNDTTVLNSSPILDIGSEVVKKAREKLGKYYVWGDEGPNTFDCSGLVYWSYNQAGYSMTRQTAQSYYDTYKDKAQTVSSSSTNAGDLLFYYSASKGYITHIAIANGSGGRIHASSSRKVVVEDNYLDNPTYILRIVTGYGNIKTNSVVLDPLPVVVVDSTEYAKASSYDTLSSIVSTELVTLSSKTDKYYGYLSDLNHGGTFKFYIPEFEESAGAKWSSIEIRGRSVPVISYESTSARSVSVSLELFAGEGIYKPTTGESGSDTVERLHKDAAFLKSLEYPDYSNSITRPPATVLLVLGDRFRLVGVVSDVTVSHLKPLDEKGRAMYLKVSFKVSQAAHNPPDYSDIRKGNYYIGGTSLTDIK